MNFPPYFAPWMWAYFAFFGTLAIVFLALTFWTWMKSTRLTKGTLKRALVWNMAGFVALFSGGWFACGIGGPPGNLLSTDPSMQNPTLAGAAAMAGMFFSVVGWVLLWVAMRTMLKAVEAKQ